MLVLVQGFGSRVDLHIAPDCCVLQNTSGLENHGAVGCCHFFRIAFIAAVLCDIVRFEVSAGSIVQAASTCIAVVLSERTFASRSAIT